MLPQMKTTGPKDREAQKPEMRTSRESEETALSEERTTGKAAVPKSQETEQPGQAVDKKPARRTRRKSDTISQKPDVVGQKAAAVASKMDAVEQKVDATAQKPDVGGQKVEVAAKKPDVIIEPTTDVTAHMTGCARRWAIRKAGFCRQQKNRRAEKADKAESWASVAQAEGGTGGQCGSGNRGRGHNRGRKGHFKSHTVWCEWGRQDVSGIGSPCIVDIGCRRYHSACRNLPA